MKTPEFQGTHLWERLHWAKDNLEKVQSDIRVVYEDPEDMDSPAKVLVPDPNWMACALQGGILPPVEVYWELAKDEAQPDFKKHTRGYLLHNTKPVEAGKGSAIFLHLTDKKFSPTKGCIAITKKDFLQILPLITKKTKLIIY